MSTEIPKLTIFSRIWLDRVKEIRESRLDEKLVAIKFDPRDQAELEKKRMILQDERTRVDMTRTLRNAINDPLLPF